ncbi:hypothetical protein GCM10010452_41530 [Crossiella cryophila]|uniref:Uncharacterized protein n=1 Tax=Crossiella cryophila TaxID=43355 RepID=A0A7W7FWJ2_9PSEU|nr:hypothetical protein [Crossiella cryophila]
MNDHTTRAMRRLATHKLGEPQPGGPPPWEHSDPGFEVDQPTSSRGSASCRLALLAAGLTVIAVAASTVVANQLPQPVAATPPSLKFQPAAQPGDATTLLRSLSAPSLDHGARGKSAISATVCGASEQRWRPT